MKILDLPLKKEWYNMIDSGEKWEEYREIKSFWIKRLCHSTKVKCEGGWYCDVSSCVKKYITINYTHVRFRYGYTKRTMLYEIDNITIGRGKTEWGAPTDKDVFIIKLKKRI